MMTSNVHKRLDKIKKDIEDLGAKGGVFHFIVGDASESAEANRDRLKAEGKITTGDEYQLITVPWVIHELKGSTFIPEGGSADPFAEPKLPPPPQDIGTSWGEQRDREQRWKDHIRQIERDGQRYDPDKPKAGGWR